MNTLVIADTKDKASIEKLKKLADNLTLLTDFPIGDSYHFVPEELEGLTYSRATYGNCTLSKFERKVFIKSEDEAFNTAVSNLLKHFRNKTGEYRPFSWRREVNLHDTLDDMNTILLKSKKQDVARYILKYDVFEPNMRFLNAKKLRFYLNRAFFRVGFEARKKKVMTTQGFKVKQYQYGIDYCIGQLTERPKCSEEELITKLNEELEKFGIRALKLEIYSLNVKAADISDFFMSEIKTDLDISKVNEAINQFNNVDEFLVKIKVPGMMRDSFVTIQIDAKPHVKDIWANYSNGVTTIRMISEAPVSFYILLPALLKTSQKNIMRFPARRLEFFKKEEVGAFDLFDDSCEECGEAIEKTPFDEPISDTYCARHLPFDDSNVQFGSVQTEEDESADKEAESIEADSAQAFDTSHDVTDVAGEGDDFDDEDEDEESSEDGMDIDG